MALIDKISNEVWFNSRDLYRLAQKQDDNFHEMYEQELKKLFMDGIGHSMYTAFHFYWHPSFYSNRFEIKCMSYNGFCEWTDEKIKEKEKILINFLIDKGFITYGHFYLESESDDILYLKILIYNKEDILKCVETAEKYFGSIKEHKEKVLRLFNEKGE